MRSIVRLSFSSLSVLSILGNGGTFDVSIVSEILVCFFLTNSSTCLEVRLFFTIIFKYASISFKPTRGLICPIVSFFSNKNSLAISDKDNNLDNVGLVRIYELTNNQWKLEESKKHTIAPAYNKGAYQVIPRNEVKDIGK